MRPRRLTERIVRAVQLHEFFNRTRPRPTAGPDEGGDAQAGDAHGHRPAGYDAIFVQCPLWTIYMPQGYNMSAPRARRHTVTRPPSFDWLGVECGKLVDEAPRSRRDRAEISRCDGARSAAPSSPGDTSAPAPAYTSACISAQIDKIAEPASGRPGVGGGVNTRSVQSALLKLMEDAEVCVVVVALVRAAHA